jgi:hypothetical protein
MVVPVRDTAEKTADDIIHGLHLGWQAGFV